MASSDRSLYHWVGHFVHIFIQSGWNGWNNCEIWCFSSIWGSFVIKLSNCDIDFFVFRHRFYNMSLKFLNLNVAGKYLNSAWAKLWNYRIEWNWMELLFTITQYREISLVLVKFHIILSRSPTKSFVSHKYRSYLDQTVPKLHFEINSLMKRHHILIWS